MSNVSSSDGGYQYYNKRIGDLEDEMRSENKRARDSLTEQSNALEANYRKSLNEHDQKSSEVADDIRQSSSEQVAKARENARNDVASEKARTYDRFGKAASEVAMAQKRSSDALQEMKKDYDRQMERQKYTPPPSEENNHITRAVNRQNESHDSESRELRGNIRDLLQAEKEYGKEQGQGRADARREIENEAKARDNLLQTSYQDQIDKLKRDNDAAARVGHDNLTEGLHAKDVEMTALVRQANQERHVSDQHQEQNFSRYVNQQKLLADNTEKNHQAQLSHQTEMSDEERLNSLNHQATSYRNQIKDLKEGDEAKINRLQKKIDVQQTSTDGSEVSPAYAEAVRQNLTRDYEKLHQANVARMQAKNDGLLEEYSKRLGDVTTEKQQRISELNAQHEIENQRERATFTDHVSDLEQTQAMTKRQADAQAEHQLSNQNRTHSQVLEKQRQSYENVLNDARTDSQARITQTNQKAEFDAKMAQRAFSQHTNELTREYEKKLSDQKTAAEDQIGELTQQMNKNIHDADRRNKQMLDEQSHGYEQRIQALEFQSKERERIISENYQDQIEKMKRANVLQQKKS